MLYAAPLLRLDEIFVMALRHIRMRAYHAPAGPLYLSRDIDIPTDELIVIIPGTVVVIIFGISP